MPFGDRLPSTADRQIANELAHLLAAQKTDDAVFCVTDREKMRLVEITLTPAISNLFLDALRCIGRGDAVTIVPNQRMLTTQQAADLLNVSRPYLIKLIEKGDIPHSMVGRHRRLKAEDVFAYKSARDKARAEALDELIADSADLY